MKPHPKFADVRTWRATRTTRPWRGFCYRVTSLSYPGPRAILSGEGSFLHGGRWNAPGSFRAVYGSTDDLVAVRESRAAAEYYGVSYPYVRPRLLVAIEFRLERVLNLSTRPLPIELGQMLGAEDWRKMQLRGEESLSQAIGRAAFEADMEALLAPSAQVDGGVNIIFFPEKKRRGSRAEVCEAESLEELEKRLA